MFDIEKASLVQVIMGSCIAKWPQQSNINVTQI